MRTIGSPTLTREPSRTYHSWMRPETSALISCRRSFGFRAVTVPVPAAVCTQGTKVRNTAVITKPIIRPVAMTTATRGARIPASVVNLSS